MQWPLPVAHGGSDRAATLTTWPETYAERGESRNRNVHYVLLCASADLDHWTVAPRGPSSLPSERVNPSRALCAASARGRRHGPGQRETITRPLRCSRATAGWKKRCSSTSAAESRDPRRVEDEALQRDAPLAVEDPRHGVPRRGQRLAAASEHDRAVTRPGEHAATTPGAFRRVRRRAGQRRRSAGRPDGGARARGHGSPSGRAMRRPGRDHELRVAVCHHAPPAFRGSPGRPARRRRRC